MKFHKEVLSDVWMQFLVLCLLMALSVDSLKYVRLVHSRRQHAFLSVWERLF